MSEPSSNLPHVSLISLSGVDAVLHELRCVEALNEVYSVAARVSLPLGTDVPALLGTDAVIEIERAGAPRRICGVLHRAAEVDATDRIVADLRIGPALGYLDMRRDSRIFQDKTVPEILETVLEALGDFGRSVQIELQRTYPIREHCVQYQESDLAFFERLVEEEGISYSFDHADEKEVLILRDENASFTDLPGGASVMFEPRLGEEGEQPEAIRSLERSHRTGVTSTVVRDWDWSAGASQMTVEAEDRATDANGKDRESYQHGRGRSLTISSYDEGVGRYGAHDAADQARLRAEGARRDPILLEGVGTVPQMAPGHVFEVSGHPTPGMDQRYLLVQTEQSVRGASDAGGSRRHECRFRCIPAEVPYRPYRRARKPAVPGSQTAVVTGPAGEEIHVDRHGRIKVRFHWDRASTDDEHSSCWVRVKQSWAGAGWGHWWVPRVGMEVVVQFVDGDPDRPLVTGTVYNGANPTPYALPDDATKSTVKSNSSIGAGYNELRFEDKAGEEEIFTHAQKDYNEVVENDHTTTVHNDQTNEVDGNQTQTIHANQTERVDGNQDMTVDANRTVHVKATFTETVSGTETRHTAGNVSETFNANETRSIGAAVTETISGNETRTVSGNQTEDIGAAHTVTIAGASDETVAGSWTLDAQGGITTITPAAFAIEAAGGQSITATAGITYVAPAGMTVKAPGGVRRVDSFWDVYCGSHVQLGYLCTEAWGLKQEIVRGLSIGLYGWKNEDIGANITGSIVDLATFGSKLETRTVEVTMHAGEITNVQRVKA